jgi:hypothetical protein
MPKEKTKVRVSNWIKISGKILDKATETHPKLFLETDGTSISAQDA